MKEWAEWAWTTASTTPRALPTAEPAAPRARTTAALTAARAVSTARPTVARVVATTVAPTAARMVAPAGPMAVPMVVPMVVPVTVAPTVARATAVVVTAERMAAPVVTVAPTAVPAVASTVRATVVRVPTAAATAVPTAARTVAQAADLEVNGAQGETGGHPAGRLALRRCTHLEPDDFAERVWGQDASLSTREQLPQGFGDLLDLDAVDRLVSRQGLRTPFLRVAKNGQTFAASRFTRGGGVGATVEDQVDDAALARLFADGATLVLQGLHRSHAPLVDFSQALAADLGHPVQVNAYVTPPQAQGFSDHYDVHDVFVLQVAGEKRWFIREPVLRHPTRDQPWTDRRAAVEHAAKQPPLIDVVLRPGDALYLPAGFLHAAQALGETSAHLTVGIHTWTRAHLLAELLRQLQGVESLREPLPLGVDVTDAASIGLELGETVDSLRSALRDVDAQVLAGRMARAAATSVRAEPVGPMAQARAAAAVDLWTRIRWRRHLRAELRRAGDEVLVTTIETSLAVPAAAEPGLRRLLAGEELTVAELGADGIPGDADRLELAASLLRHALVVPA
jgi:lysine-specific demethylase/histidyl-hydroxylase NO66